MPVPSFIFFLFTLPNSNETTFLMMVTVKTEGKIKLFKSNCNQSIRLEAFKIIPTIHKTISPKMNFKQFLDFYTLNSTIYTIYNILHLQKVILQNCIKWLYKKRPTRGQSKMFNLIVCTRGAFMKSLFIENLFKRRYVVG